jgi:hypothetical protein
MWSINHLQQHAIQHQQYVKEAEQWRAAAACRTTRPRLRLPALNLASMFRFAAGQRQESALPLASKIAAGQP